jgi:hypothetical protein
MGEATRLIESLEADWSIPDGFLYRARQGIFDPVEGEAILDRLQNIELPDGSVVDRRIVALLWYLPHFLSWQERRVAENGGDTKRYHNLVSRVLAALEGILGVP